MMMPQPQELEIGFGPTDVDQPVVEAVVQGNRHAFEELCEKHGHWVRAVIFGVLCDADRLDDVAQQVWTTFWSRIGRLRDTHRWRPWLYRLARNAAVDASRERSRLRRTNCALQAEVRVGATQVAPIEQVAQSEKHAAVLDAVKGLPTIYREPFVLRHIQDWNYRQIAEVMELPVDTVETRLVRARRILRETLKDKV